MLWSWSHLGLLYDVLAQRRRFFNNRQQRSRNCPLPASVSPLITNKRGARVWSLLGWVCEPGGGAHEETRDQTAQSSPCQGEGAATVLAVKHTEPVLRAMGSDVSASHSERSAASAYKRSAPGLRGRTARSGYSYITAPQSRTTLPGMASILGYLATWPRKRPESLQTSLPLKESTRW